jgi:glutaredoxin-like protein
MGEPMHIEIEAQTLEWTKFQLGKMKELVKLKVFTTKGHCILCNAIMDLVTQLSALSPKIQMEICSCEVDDLPAKKYSIDKHPALLVHGKEEYNVRFFGMPMGFEFGVLIDDIVTASTEEPDLGEDVKLKLRSLTKPVHIQVFTLPTCPRCPYVARMAHNFAFYNKDVTADAVDILEFRELAAKYRVLDTPKTVINDKVEIVGVLPEWDLADKVLMSV